MNLNRLFAISVILSIIAIALSSATLLYVINPFQKQIGNPSFNIYSHEVQLFNDFARIYLRNNGTATAHNIRIEIIFAWGGPEITEFIPELQADRGVLLSIPIGSEQIGNHKTLFIHIECNELQPITSFQFEL